MLAIRGVSEQLSNYMVFDPAVGPWRTVSLSSFGGYDTNEVFRYFTEIFKPIYDVTIIPGTEENGWNEIATARFPTGKPIKLRLLKPEYFGVNQWGDPTYKFPVFRADGLDGTGAGPGLDEPWRLIELNLANVPFSEIRVPNNGLQFLDVRGNNLLQILDCSLNSLTSATFNMTDSGVVYEGVRSVTTLRVRSNNLTTAPFISEANCMVTGEYDAANNQITTVAVSSLAPERFDVSNQFPNNAAQGLTSLSFSDEINRPSFWYVQNNRLTSLPLGISGVGESSGWGAVRELDCSNNLLTELVFPDGPPPANLWGNGSTPGGYLLASLNVSNNQLTTLDLRYVDTLLDLDVSDNAPLSSLTLPNNAVITYDANDSRVNLLWNDLGQNVPDAITGDWSDPPLSGTFSNNSFFYRHTRGPRRLIVRNCPALSQISAISFGTALMSVRELDISGSGLTSLPNSNPSPIFGFNTSTGNHNFATIVPSNYLVNGFRISGTVPAGTSGPSQGTSYQTLAQQNMYASGRFAVLFRNLTASGSPPSGFNRPSSGTAYMLHAALRESNNVTTYFFTVTDRHDLEKQRPTYITLSGVTGGEVAIYSLFGGMPFLETFTAENCPNLTRLSLIGCPLLKKSVIRNCPLLGTGDVTTGGPAVRSVFPGTAFAGSDRWTGISGQLTHLEIENCPSVIHVVREQAPFDRNNFDRLIISNVLGVSSGQGQISISTSTGSAPTYGIVCRNGIQLTNNSQMTASNIETFLSRVGTWSFSPPLATDSNVISFAGTPYPSSRRATAVSGYDARKAGAISRGWQVIDPTFV
jgi:hypothetical protein